MQDSITIGSRGSPLALIQARTVQRLLGEAAGVAVPEYEVYFPIQIFKTTGDVLTGRLAEAGGKGLFVKELDEALARGTIDMAVHSMKDVPTTLDDMFQIAAVLPREDVRDAFISLKVKQFMDLPHGATLGTASLRRQAQAARLRPDLRIELLRGNVGTRLLRLEQGDCDATFLATAGLNRLGQTDVITHRISPDDMLPAPAQGAVGVQIRAQDIKLAKRVSVLHCSDSAVRITAERAFLKSLDGSCRTPVAALAEIDGHSLRFRGQALSPDGRLSFERDETVSLSGDRLGLAYATGYSLGMDIRFEAGHHIQWDL